MPTPDKLHPPAPASPQQEVPSPCVRNCCLDAHDICLGCGRSISEICAWREASPLSKIQILEESALRLANRQRGKF